MSSPRWSIGSGGATFAIHAMPVACRVSLWRSRGPGGASTRFLRAPTRRSVHERLPYPLSPSRLPAACPPAPPAKSDPPRRRSATRRTFGSPARTRTRRFCQPARSRGASGRGGARRVGQGRGRRGALESTLQFVDLTTGRLRPARTTSTSREQSSLGRLVIRAKATSQVRSPYARSEPAPRRLEAVQRLTVPSPCSEAVLRSSAMVIAHVARTRHAPFVMGTPTKPLPLLGDWKLLADLPHPCVSSRLPHLYLAVRTIVDCSLIPARRSNASVEPGCSSPAR